MQKNKNSFPYATAQKYYNYQRNRHIFKKNDGKAIDAIIRLLKVLKLSDRTLGLHTRCNAIYKTADKLLTLMLFPIFGVKNPANYAQSTLADIAHGKKDLFYRMLNSKTINWRNVNYKMFGKLYNKIKAEGEQDGPTCLIVDVTELKKRGYKIEFIGKVFSHVSNIHTLGFKLLSLCYDDGKQLLNFDCSLHGEMGKNGKQGLTDKQLRSRKQEEHSEENADYERIQEYFGSKTKALFGMLRRFSQRGHKADYLLADSWFTSIELIRLVRKLKGIGHYLGLTKLNDTKYTVSGKQVTAKQLSRKKSKRRICYQLGITFIEVSALFQDVPVKLFISGREVAENWRVMLTTDLSLSFEQAYRIYARRWNIEVFFKECKQHLNFGKCQSQKFNAQMAATTISLMQYNILATVKRFESYETFGELFRAARIGVAEATVTQRMWHIIKELGVKISKDFNLEEDFIIEKYLNDKEVLRKLIDLETLHFVA